MNKMKKILIVEDEEILLKVLVDRFQAAGWEVVSAEDGEKATQAIESHKDFNVVLLDLLLPKKSGMVVLKTIRSTQGLENLPVVMLSNLGDTEDIQKAMRLGATNYFIKTQHPISEILEEAAKYLKEK